jgi:hypothetical protein
VHRLLDDRLERRRVVGIELGRPGDVARHHRPDDRGVVVADERAPLRGQLVQQHAERVDVDAAIERLGAALLGRHVRELALGDAGRGRVLALRRLGDPEVDQLDRAGVGDDDVRRTDVAVDQAERLAVVADQLVGEVAAGGGADDDRQRVGQRQLAALLGQLAEQRAAVVAVQVLHRVVVEAALLAEVVDVGDVRVIERRGVARLVQEHPHELGVLGEARQDPLHDDVLGEAGQAGHARQVDLGHPADREASHDLVPSDPGAGRQGVVHVRARGYRGWLPRACVARARRRAPLDPGDAVIEPPSGGPAVLSPR